MPQPRPSRVPQMNLRVAKAQHCNDSYGTAWTEMDRNGQNGTVGHKVGLSRCSAICLDMKFYVSDSARPGQTIQTVWLH